MTSSADNFRDDLDDFLAEESQDPRFAAAFADAEARTKLLSDLITCRKALRLTQREVAQRMDTTQSAISEIENGHSDLFVSTLQRYARAVTAKVRWVMDLPCDGPWSEDATRSSYVRRDTHVSQVVRSPARRSADWNRGALSASGSR